MKHYKYYTCNRWQQIFCVLDYRSLRVSSSCQFYKSFIYFGVVNIIKPHDTRIRNLEKHLHQYLINRCCGNNVEDLVTRKWDTAIEHI